MVGRITGESKNIIHCVIKNKTILIMEDDFKKYRRILIAEMRPVTEHEANNPDAILDNGISIAVEDLANGSPKVGDMIARNPKNHNDQWLISHEDFIEHFKPINQTNKILFRAKVNSDLAPLIEGWYCFDEISLKNGVNSGHYIVSKDNLKRYEIIPDTLEVFIDGGWRKL